MSVFLPLFLPRPPFGPAMLSVVLYSAYCVGCLDYEVIWQGLTRRVR